MATRPRSAKQLANDERLRNAAKTKTVQPHGETTVAPQTQTDNVTQLITLTPEQLNELVNRLSGSNQTDKATPPSFSQGLQTNSQGQLVGTTTKYNIDPDYYPNPIERLTEFFDNDARTRRLAFSENYFVTWDIDAKPYETKTGVSTQEPTFHTTLYMNMYDEEGDETEKAIVVQTLHFNEDDQLAFAWAAENGMTPTVEAMRQIMDEVRFERVKQWCLDIFFPPRNFEPTTDFVEQAIGGSVVKVITKSNVKGFGNSAPKITEEELQ